MAKPIVLEQNGNRVKFGPVDTSYMHVVERWTPDGADKGFYSVMLLIPKGATDVINAIKRCVDAAIKEGITKHWNNKKPSNLALPLKDGDDKDDPDLAGCYYINAKAKEHRPGLGVVRNGAVVKDDFPEVDNWYSGNKVLASVTFFPYKASGNVGVTCGLDSLVQINKGERKAGSPSLEKDFGNIDLSGLGIGEDAEDDDL